MSPTYASRDCESVRHPNIQGSHPPLEGEGVHPPIHLMKLGKDMSHHPHPPNHRRRMRNRKIIRGLICFMTTQLTPSRHANSTEVRRPCFGTRLDFPEGTGRIGVRGSGRERRLALRLKLSVDMLPLARFTRLRKEETREWKHLASCK